jgi:coproporphyrinogen III oxidase-like Fe-S oxidoreductase
VHRTAERGFVQLRSQFGPRLDAYDTIIAELAGDGLLVRAADNLKLTPRGRLLSNEVFQRFIANQQFAAI